jgi:diguanylate cyclase (GGDEF)-like protein/PAS domain S-box-containing protein
MTQPLPLDAPALDRPLAMRGSTMPEASGARPDLDAVFAAIVARSRRLFEADAVGLWHFDAAAERPFSLAAESGVHPDLLAVVADLRRDEPAPGLRALAERTIVVIDRSRAYNARLRAIYEREGIETVCFVPVVLDAEPIALLVLYHRRDHAWSDEARALARGFAEHAAMAIGNARLYASVQTLAARLRAIQDLGLRLDRIRDVRAIGEAIVAEVRTLLDVDTVRVYRVAEGHGICEPIAFWGHFLGVSDPSPAALAVRVGDGLTGWVAEHGVVVRVGDAAADPRSRVVGRVTGPESMLLVPMRSETRTLGLIVVSKEGRDRFTADDEQLLTIFAAYAAQALVNAEHHSRLQEQQAALERQLAGQRRLLEVTERLVAARDPASVLEAIADALHEVVHYDTLTIYRVDRTAGVRRAILARDRYADVILGHVAPLDRGLTGWAIAHRQPVLANDAHLDPRSVQIPGTPFEPESVIVVPLLSGDEVIGTLNLGRIGAAEAHFSATEFELAQLFAAQAAMALQNAEAHRAAAERARLDSLTGLHNHGAFQADLARAVAAGPDGPFALLMLDLDGFKTYNDRWGHPAGDELLRRIASAIAAAIRAGDRAYRYGGDEFAVLLPGATRAQARRIESRIRAAILQLHGPDGSPTVGVSAGLACFPADARRPEDLVLVADRALYLAKPAALRRADDPREAELTALTETTAALIARRDRDALLETIVERAGALLGVGHAVLYLVDEARDRLVLAAGTGRFARWRTTELARGEGLAGRTWASGTPQATDDYEHYPFRTVRRPRGLGAVVTVPLTVADEVIGVLGVASGDRRRTFTEREHLILGRFAQLASVALDNARLLERARQEVSERAAAEAELRASEERFRRLADAAGEALVIHQEGRILQVNRPFEELFRCRPGSAVGRSVLDFATPESLPALAEHWQHHPDDAVELLARGDDGSVFPVRVVGRPIPWGDGQARVASIRDLREQRGLEAQLASVARLDRLTGLANRDALREEVAAVLEDADAADAEGPARRAASLVLLDLDRFTTINESLGHAAGDELLVATARRLREACRPTDTVARVGSDEFAVLLAHPAEPESAVGVAERLLGVLRQPIRIAGHEVYPSASVGVVQAAEAATPDALLRDAEVALHRAKAAGGDRVVRFEPPMRIGRHDRLDLEADLRRAIERRQLRLHYQPIVDLATGAPQGFEALLRWEHPERGLVPPLAFVPLAEETGLIVEIGRWVVETACRAAASWGGRVDVAPPFVGVNLSPRQFADPSLVDHVATVLRTTGLPASQLELEITESVLMDEAGVGLGVLRALKELGVRLALDDFGTGYASLGYLTRLPLDAIKIDRTFVARLPDDPATHAIVRAIVGLAHDLGMAVVAEGIETADQERALAELGCDRGQGYRWSVPLPPERLADWLPLPTSSGGRRRPGIRGEPSGSTARRRPAAGTRPRPVRLSRGSSRRAGAA